MRIGPEQNDAAVVGEIGRRLARHRLEANETQASLAGRAGISTPTLARLEKGEPVALVTLIRVMRALDLAGNIDDLVPAPLPSPLARVRDEARVRKRASG
jgi:transcriptional regulator with XRE-family HTH domain